MRLVDATKGVAVAAVACLTAIPATAQSVARLEERVAALENKATAGAVLPKSVLGFELNFYGYAQGEIKTDSDYDLGLNGGGIAGITPLTLSDRHSRVHAYQSRLGLRGSKETDSGKLSFNIEGDFYGGGGGSFRLRHAYGAWNSLLAGQTWSVFGVAFGTGPSSPIDFNGAFGNPGPRVAQIRYTYEISDTLKAAVSIEEDNASAVADRPAFATALKWTSGTNILAISALSRSIKWSGGSTDGWGVNIGGQVAPWEGGLLHLTATTGTAISGYLQGNPFSKLMPSDYFQSELDANGNGIDASAFSIGMSQKFGDKFEIGAAYGMNKYDAGSGTPSTGLEKLSSAHLTLKYTPVKDVLIGLEYIKSTKSLYDGTDFDNDRILGLVRFSF